MGRKRQKKVQCPDCGIMMSPPHVPVHLATSCKGPDYKPDEEQFTAEYIKAVCREIQEEWDPKEKIKRMVAKRPVPWRVPEPRGLLRRKDVSE